MKRANIINGSLAGAVAVLRHTDLVAVTDAGFPAGPRDRVIDLSVVPGTPTLWEVLGPILAEVEIEHAWTAEEASHVNPEQQKIFDRALPHASRVPHDELKRIADAAVLVIRTGDKTPYSNVVLRCGYPF